MPVEIDRSTLILVLIVAWVFILSCVSFVMFAIDKSRARHGRWRVPESRLHLLEWLGGWPGAFMGMAILRHKRRKGWYVAQTVAAAITWVITAAWLFGAWRSP